MSMIQILPSLYITRAKFHIHFHVHFLNIFCLKKSF